MKKNTLSALLCAGSLSVLGLPSAVAESVAVEGDSVFILDNSVAGSQIVVKNFTSGAPDSCLTDASLNLLGLGADTTATDIMIKNATAVITTYNNTSLITDVKLVNVANCVTNQTIPVKECITTVNNGLLTIPCVQYNGEILSVVLEQRGNSMNWELKSSPILNDTFKGYKADDDND
ncbi:hypothetical protein [Nitrosomonas sp. Nm166]|uniref:hypothetical protein n=1 Tax=Nitrosomonas sp. Nm166 TaxID=1881054 RepID=UPI0008E26B37|nr:hypothetical protein [Nitrosomonas sp. Nm166]SFE65878.1 hypothetical protein SAMN05428977_102436 [Nitrosomonas sp. Nm166]